jgi:hypothetical protein
LLKAGNLKQGGGRLVVPGTGLHLSTSVLVFRGLGVCLSPSADKNSHWFRVHPTLRLTSSQDPYVVPSSEILPLRKITLQSREDMEFGGTLGRAGQDLPGGALCARGDGGQRLWLSVSELVRRERG